MIVVCGFVEMIVNLDSLTGLFGFVQLVENGYFCFTWGRVFVP